MDKDDAKRLTAFEQLNDVEVGEAGQPRELAGPLGLGTGEHRSLYAWEPICSLMVRIAR